MNVFDDEMGPLASIDELEGLRAHVALLVEAGLTLEQYRAYLTMLGEGKVN